MLTTNKIVTFLKLDVLFINAFGKYIFDETVFQHSYEGLALKPKSLSYLPHWILDERHHTARVVSMPKITPPICKRSLPTRRKNESQRQ